MTNIDILNTSWKTEVTPEQSAEIQRLLFKFGKKWTRGKTEILHTEGKFLFYDGELMWNDCPVIFFEQEGENIKADDIIAPLRNLEEGNEKMLCKSIVVCPDCQKFLYVGPDNQPPISHELVKNYLDNCTCKIMTNKTPVIEETNEDGWICIYKYMPPLSTIVELRKNYDYSIINGYLSKRRLSDGEEYYILFDKSNNTIKEGISEWRPIKDKRPDFGKLRGGDFLIVESKNEIAGLFFISQNSENITLKSINFKVELDAFQKAILSDYQCEIPKELIKKITRINLETREVEEI